MFPFFRHGILGLNARNLLYLKPYNPRKAVAFADNKLKTKAFLSARGIPSAKLYGKIENREQLRAFDFASLPDECVLKPNYGFGGEGILILKGRKNGMFLEQGKYPLSDQYLREHIEDILDGKFSVNNKQDTAFFEKILTAHEGFSPFRPAGLPDVRIVVFNLVPVMAMLRVPTVQSGGKANVHMGGLGIGIDIAKGVTTHAFQYSHLLQELPHGGLPAGVPIPFWEELLLIASRIQYITNIGYLAVDLTLDADQGPVLLEVNARAGLMVQVANLAPLRTRLERVRGLSISSPEKGVRMAQDLFGHKLERGGGAAPTLDRPRLGVREVVTVHAAGSNLEVPAVIGAAVSEYTVFTPELLMQLREQGGVTPMEASEGNIEEREGFFHVKFTLGGQKIQTIVRGGTVAYPSARAIVGRRDLVGFYIDPAKVTEEKSLVAPRKTIDLRATDRILAQADQELLLLKYLRPINLPEERRRLEEDPHYNPLFLYPPLPDTLDDMQRRIESLQFDDSSLGMLLQKKQRELRQRMSLFRARGDARAFTEASQLLFGIPRTSLIGEARAFLRSRQTCDLPPTPETMMTAEQAAARFEKALAQYGLHDWHIVIRTSLVADCAVGWKRLYIRQDAMFAPEHVESLVAHEIETHILTAENGDQQPYDLFRRGFANYLDTQEGLATYHQNRVLPPGHDRRYAPARGVLAVSFALEHSFVQTRRYLEEELDYTPDRALTKVIELKRGLHDTSEHGCFTKGLVYFRGVRAIERFLSEGGDIRDLYYGKIALEDLALVKAMDGLKKPQLIPAYLREKKEK